MNASLLSIPPPIVYYNVWECTGLSAVFYLLLFLSEMSLLCWLRSQPLSRPPLGIPHQKLCSLKKQNPSDDRKPCLYVPRLLFSHCCWPTTAAHPKACAATFPAKQSHGSGAGPGHRTHASSHLVEINPAKIKVRRENETQRSSAACRKSECFWVIKMLFAECWLWFEFLKNLQLPPLLWNRK